MEDGNFTNDNEESRASASYSDLCADLPPKITANGHDLGNEGFDRHDNHTQGREDRPQEDKFRQRINPLKIHLGKRPYVDNSAPYYNTPKKKQICLNRSVDFPNAYRTPVPRVVPKLIPKKVNKSRFHNASLPVDCNNIAGEDAKPVPRLVPKSQLTQYKKNKTEKGSQLKEYAQYLGLQPMVKFKCRKCCSMFKSLALLREHQQVCRAQAREPAVSPDAAHNSDSCSSGPSRVTRKVYLCSACGTYYENWNLFLHMREVHNRHICLFCLGMFSKAEKLSSHLINKHNVKENSYSNKEEFFSVYSGSMYLMCSDCDAICSEQDDIFNHDCNNVKPKPVPMLVSKNASKTLNKTFNKNIKETSTPNGPIISTKEMQKQSIDAIFCDDKKDELKNEATPKVLEPLINTTDSNMKSCKLNESTDCINSLENPSIVKNADVIPNKSVSPLRLSENTHLNLNVNEYSPEVEKEVSSYVPADSSSLDIPNGVTAKINEIPPLEKECGIKLKLSLNNAKSPVIINSTVDPSIGKQNVNKPPSRIRRPPKRYEKDSPNVLHTPPCTPTIKMTISQADSPFVKTTIIENKKESQIKSMFNNNIDTPPKIFAEIKPENSIKTTIYDNPEEINTLNRVPKLTVRVPKELLDKDSSSDYSSDSDASDKLTVDENNVPDNEVKDSIPPSPKVEKDTTEIAKSLDSVETVKTSPTVNEEIQHAVNETNIDGEAPKEDIAEEPTPLDVPPSEKVDEPEELTVTELSLDRPLDKYPLKELLKLFLSSTVHSCIYCNHVRKIAVNCEQLALHMAAQHRFSATVDSITAEELMPETITAKVRVGAEEVRDIYINLDSYDSIDECENVVLDQNFECFQCYFKTTIHKDLYLHNRKMHQKTILLCVMCKTNFYSYSELLCHLCPGTYDSEYEIRFRCCLCQVDSIPSSFRLMVHLRKIHHTCDVCLEYCLNQARLSNHVWKHKLHHLCYRCGIAYRNKPDITKHLFWKHGTQSVNCKKCLQKKWPHVYHFCTPPNTFICDECSLTFTRAVCLRVHKRIHTGEYPHVCQEEACTEKFVSKKLLAKHSLIHREITLNDKEVEKKEVNETQNELAKETIPVIDLVDDVPKVEIDSADLKPEIDPKTVKKSKKKKQKDKDLLLDVNLPALNLSESDSSDESDSGAPTENDIKVEKQEQAATEEQAINSTTEPSISKTIEKVEPLEDEKPNEQQALDIWDNFKKYQAKVEKQKTPPLVPIRKHVCESDHDYCLIPPDLNGEDGFYSPEKKKKSPKKKHGAGSSSSSSSSDSDSSCSCGSNCSCSSSSGSSSSSSSDLDSSDSGKETKKKKGKKSLANRRGSCGSQMSAVDVMGMAETPILIPEKKEPPIAETDLETDETETDEEFYDEHPQKLANKLYAEKRNQLLLLASVAPSDNGSVSREISRCATPIKEEQPKEKEKKIKGSSSKKKSKKKKKSKSSRRQEPIKINIPKEIITQAEVEPSVAPLIPNKITISLQSNTVQIPEIPKIVPNLSHTKFPLMTSADSKRASKRRRVPNKFYGYSSDEETPQQAALKPQQPPKLEWRKEDLPSPAAHRSKKEVPSSTILNKTFTYPEPIRLTTPIPDPEPPRILMNTESMESSESESSDEGALEICQPNAKQNNIPAPPPHLNSGTSSLPYPFQRPAGRQAREGESVYCYCRCPYDEVSEMIGCDADGCSIEWFHFECVGIMVPPKGRWYCPECRKKQSYSGYR